MTETISKSALRERLGLKTDSELAAFYGISRAAVAQWPEDGVVPERRVLQAVLKRPDAFPDHTMGAAAADKKAA